MSMYQIEDLVEYSIRQLFSVPTDRQQLRSDIHYLYEFQNQFDCSFTNFRLLSGLLDCGYILLLAPRQHPLYDTEQEEFERIMQRDFGYTPGAEGGYWYRTIKCGENEKLPLNKLCCDYVSPLWKQLVSEGRLSGNAATPLPPLNPYELVFIFSHAAGNGRRTGRSNGRREKRITPPVVSAARLPGTRTGHISGPGRGVYE